MATSIFIRKVHFNSFFFSVNRQSIPLVVGNLILEQLYFSHFLVHGSFEKREFSDFDTIERESRRLYLF